MARSRLAILIPAYNEERTIADVISRALAWGDVFVVDDASRDATSDVAAQAGARVLRLDSNRGYDGALQAGYGHLADLGYEAFVTLDADGQLPPEMLETYGGLLLEDGIDLVLGVRLRKARLSEIIMSAYFRARFGIHDVLCGLKGYRIEACRGNDDFSAGGGIGTELAFNLLKSRASFREVPVLVRDRLDEPRFGSLLRANLKILASLARILRKDLGF